MSSELFSSDRDTFLSLNRFTGVDSSILAGFTVKDGGTSKDPYASLNMGLHVQDVREDVVANRRLCAAEAGISLENWVFADQVHGKRIVKAGQKERGSGAFHYDQAILEADGLYTNQTGLVLALAYADCVPIFFYEKKAKLIGIAHAGWKGSVLNIGGEMIAAWLEAEGASLENIHAAIGPSIGPCCYKVDDSVISKVNKLFNHHEELPWVETEPGQYRLDLKKLNAALLKKAGLSDNQISVSGLCTCCEKDLFFSHRRDAGRTGRMIGFIGLKEEDS
ncbi:peptidoglycan editing factor PgeF [Metabacillus sp. 84]|uniref:peptidoglycan editing factor PgeF n=1 Tax=Metabacillus sp. 84 TaxID=3404705 RepID=UPI003CF9E8FB